VELALRRLPERQELALLGGYLYAN